MGMGRSLCTQTELSHTQEQFIRNRSGGEFWQRMTEQLFSQYTLAHPQSLLVTKCRFGDVYIMPNMNPSSHVLCLAV